MGRYGLVAGLLAGLFLGMWFSYDVQPRVVRSVFNRPGYVVHVVRAIPAVATGSVPNGHEYVARFGLERTIQRKSISDSVIEQLTAPLIRRVTGRLAGCLVMGGVLGSFGGWFVGTYWEKQKRRGRRRRGRRKPARRSR
ncbi:MAG: hypothetical protein JJU11_03920 [Candidatus Sumerlaeia bacterium]|nr:hypothetical protein [Candidatus Sumerlaeia bacterium]